MSDQPAENQPTEQKHTNEETLDAEELLREQEEESFPASDAPGNY